MTGNAYRRRLAAVRAEYSEEPRWLAARGIPGHNRDVLRDNLGFDRCKPEQRRFRATMALHLLNTLEVPPNLKLGPESSRMALSGVSRLIDTSIVVSPQFDDLSVLTDVADHLVQCISSPGDSTHGVPGLRAVDVENDGECLLLRHLPTGASLRFRHFERNNPRRHKPPWFFGTNWAGLRRGPVIGPEEQATLRAVPPMHEDAERLLAGLVARITCWHKREGWAVSRLTHDDISGRHRSGNHTFLHLWGGDTDWVLRWGGYGSVPATDVARALTHDIIGVTGASYTSTGADQAEVRLGKARLVLEVHQASYARYFDSLQRVP